MIGWFLKRLGIVTKYDLNEYARLFKAGEDLVIDGDRTVTPRTAMRIATVMACVQVLAQTIASLPLRVYRRLPGGGAEEAPDHPLYRLLYARPNRRQTSFEWLETMVTHIALQGNAISLKKRQNGKLRELVPVDPSRVILREYNDVLVYQINMRGGETVSLISDDIFHVRGLATDGYWAQSVIGASRDTFQLAQRVQKYGQSVFESGGAKRVLLKFPNSLGDKAIENLRRSWEEMGRNSAKTAILEQGGDAITVGMDADEAQYLETRKFNREEICGLFRVPPHMVADLSRATYSNIEKQDLFFVKHTVRPWLKRLEAAITRDLLGSPEKFVVKFNVDALLRGDIKTRTEASKTQFMHGALTINEWRERENLNPIDDEFGDQHFVPINLTLIDRLGEQSADQDEQQQPDGGLGGEQNEPTHYLEPIVRDIAERLARAEIRGAADWKDFEEFRSQQRRYAYRAMCPLFEAAGIEDEDRRAELATQLAGQLREGSEIDIETRSIEIVAMLMAEIAVDPIESARWFARSVEARRTQLAAVEPDEPSPVTWAGTVDSG